MENLRDCKVLVELLVTEEGTVALSGAKFGKCLKVSSSRVLPSPLSVDAGRGDEFTAGGAKKVGQSKQPPFMYFAPYSPREMPPCSSCRTVLPRN